jgi:hypothetical protein
MTTTHFESIGGHDQVRRLVDRFYDLMETRPEAAGILALHPPDLSSSREKLFLFLVGWMGGPPLYMQKYGHPRLRAPAVSDWGVGTGPVAALYAAGPRRGGRLETAAEPALPGIYAAG